WLGSDLIFDIDADHYQGCDKTIYICISENKVFEEKISQCPKSNEKPLAYSLLSSECLERAFVDVKKLYSILRDEFGFKDIAVYFSGNRGFHVKVFDENVWSLTSDERREIASYISLEGFELFRVFPSIGKRTPYILLSSREYGIRKRVLKHVIEKNIGEKTGAYVKVSVDEAERIINELKIDIDAVVTMDISRLSRFGNSINGKSGLIVKRIDINSFDKFDFLDYCPWEGVVRIKPLVDISGLSIYDNIVNLKKGLTFDIDACLGLYLVFKGLARLVNIDRVGVRNV
ncbi:MAG: DNA primase, partial [Staphylothermus sp.]|nr:DNA primase [Staphylothermus sp.]